MFSLFGLKAQERIDRMKLVLMSMLMKYRMTSQGDLAPTCASSLMLEGVQ